MRTECLWLVATMVQLGVVFAEDQNDAPVPIALDAPSVGFGWVIVFMIALIGAAALVQKRFGVGALHRGNAGLKMIATLPLGDKRAIVVVEVADERLLVGITSQNVQLISHLKSTDGPPDEPEDASRPDRGSDGALRSGRFYDLFRKAMQRGARQ